MAASGIDANRREIAAAACELVADGGLDSVSMRRIAKHLGSTTGYISHYYVDKEDLLEAALRAALHEITAHSGPRSTNFEEWIDRAVGTLPHGDVSQRFWRVLMAFQTASLNSPRLAEVLRTYVVEQESTLARHLTAMIEPARADTALADRASVAPAAADVAPAAAVDPDRFAGDEPDHQIASLARSLFALVAGLGTTATITPDAFTAEQQRVVVRSAAHALLDEFSARQPGSRPGPSHATA